MEEPSASADTPAGSFSRRQLQLFLAFFRVGMLGYGGGPSSIPLVHKEAVDSYRWMNEDEFADVLALGNTLPGPIATKMAGYIGYRVGGFLGMLNAVLATIVPTIVIIIVLLTALTNFSEEPFVQGMTRAVVPVVGVMLGVLTWQFFARSGEGLGWLKALLLLGASLGLVQYFGLHPGFIIGALLVYALAAPAPRRTSRSPADVDLEEEHLAEGGPHPPSGHEADTAADIERGIAEAHRERAAQVDPGGPEEPTRPQDGSGAPKDERP